METSKWKSPIGMKKENDGTRKIVVVGPPWIWFEMTPKEIKGKTDLVLETAQQKYEFRPVSLKK